ncbi:hypothetical protein WN943_020405 [Citrus x changshan-huyou]
MLRLSRLVIIGDRCRSRVIELFSMKRVQSFQFIREEEVASLVNSISQASSSASPADLSQKIFALSGSIQFRVAFGRRFQGMAELCLREEASLPRNVLSVLVGSLTDSVVIMQRLRAFSRKWILSSNRLIKDHLVKAETTTKQKHEDIINGHAANLEGSS